MMIVLPSRSLSSLSSAMISRDGPAVEIAGRLVGEQQVRLVRERARDRDALLLAAGQLPGPVLWRSAEAHRFEEAGCRARPARHAARRRTSSPARRSRAALIVETRLNDWKMMPTFCRRWRLSSMLDICARS